MICFCSNCRDNFDDESPFHPDTSSTADQKSEMDCDSDIKPLTIDHFQEETKESFTQMINEIKVCVNDVFSFYLIDKISTFFCRRKVSM